MAFLKSICDDVCIVSVCCERIGMVWAYFVQASPQKRLADLFAGRFSEPVIGTPDN